MSKEVVTDDTSDTCVLCCHVSNVWAVGECNHPTCLVCSSRMRILCDQKDCPVCRLLLNQVVIVTDVRPFQNLVYRKWPSKLKYNMYFERWDLLDLFHYITDNRCQLCPHLPPQRSFKKLKEHIKGHGLFFCDICVDGLKLFPSEFKLYTRSELTSHRRQGDGDDKSYKGHPYCQFCDERFLDNDTLHMHLRKNHFWCHFCENEGKQDYYIDCHSLKEHFRDGHFLCEEGDCKHEILTSAFGNEIDLKAHRANVHSKGMSKAEAKQMRALPVEFSIAGHQHDYDVPQTKRRGHSAIVVGYAYGDGEKDSDMRALQIREKEEREPLAVTTTHSTKSSSERSNKYGKSSPPSLTKKKRCAQGQSHGAAPPHLLPPPGFDGSRSDDNIETSSKDSHGENRNHSVKDKGDPTKNNCWPSLGAAASAPPPLPSTPPPPPPGLKRRETSDVKNCGSIKVAQLPSKSLETRSLGNIKQSSSQKLVSLKFEASETGKTIIDSSSTSGISGLKIFDDIRQALGYNQEKFREFQTLSGWYRSGGVSIGEYNAQCEKLFGQQWLVLGPQLARVMPRGESKEKLVDFFAPKMSYRNGVRLNEGGNTSKKKKNNSKTRKDEDAWVTVGGRVGARQTTAGGQRSKTAFSEEDYPSLATAAKLPPQSKVPMHSAWNVQVHT